MADDPGKAAPASDKDIQSGSVAAADHDAVSAASLLAASSRQAVRGLRAHNENEHDDAALHLGLRIELLAKAYLASLNPALIAEGNDLENLVRVVGHGGLLVGKPKPMGPVGVTVALQRVGQLNVKDPQLHELAGLLRPVGEARNGMAHLGRAGGDPGELAQLAVTGASLLLPLISQSVEGFFRDYAMAAKALLDARATRVQRRLALRAVSCAREL